MRQTAISGMLLIAVAAIGLTATQNGGGAGGGLGATVERHAGATLPKELAGRSGGEKQGASDRRADGNGHLSLCESNPIDLILDYFNIHDYSIEGEPDVPETTADSFRLIHEALLRRNYDVNALIAIVPDPIDSHFDLIFDRHVSAIERAAEAENYQLDRFWLPWQCDMLGKSEEQKEQHEVRPGLLLFRRRNGEAKRNELLAVFLVGSTPTGGVNRVVFAKSLDFAAELLKVKWGQEKTASAMQIPILGSPFSGARYSTRDTIEEWVRAHLRWHQLPARDLHLRIISGGATALDNRDYLTFSATSQPVDDPRDLAYTAVNCSEHFALLSHSAPKNVRVDFSATTLSDSIVEGAVRDYLQKTMSIDWSSQVAMLVEGNTAYGQNIAQTSAPRLVLHFPGNISEVRGAYARSDVFSLSRSAPLDAARKVLELSFDDANSARIDTTPFASKTSPATAALVLDNIFSTLAREDVRAVGIAASNPMDVIFLAHELREHVPNLRLFTLSNDLLYLHPQVAVDTQGMVVAGSYPLFPDNQRWSSDRDIANLQASDRLPVGSEGEEAVYNAVVTLIGGRHLLEYDSPFASSPASTTVASGARATTVPGDSADPSKNSAYRRPVPWVIAVGREFPIPLATYDSSKLLDNSSKDPSPLEYTQGAASSNQTRSLQMMLVSPSFPSPVLFFLFATFALLQCLAFQWKARASQEVRYAPSVGTIASYDTRSGRPYLIIALATLYFLQLEALAVATIPPMYFCGVGGFRASEWMQHSLGQAIGCAYGTVVLLVLAVTLGWVVLKPHSDDATTAFTRPQIVRGGALVLVFALSCSIVHSVWFDYESPRFASDALLFYQRATCLSSGLSPLLGLLLMGGAVYSWAWYQLARQHIRACEFQMFPADTTATGKMGRQLRLISLVESFVGERIESLYFQYPKALHAAVGTGFMVFSYKVLSRHITLDRSVWEWAFSCGLPIIAVLAVYESIRLYYYWRAYRRLLRQFDALPLGEAFARLPDRYSSMGTWLFGRLPVVRELQFAVDLISEAAGLDPAASGRGYGGASRGALLTAGNELSVAFEGTFKHPEQTLRGADSLRICLEQAAVQCIPVLDDGDLQWRQRAQDFLAARIVLAVNAFYMHLRNIVTFTTTTMMLLLLAVSAYPLLPQRFLITSTWVAMLTTVGFTLYSFVDAERDSVLSRIAKTKAGEIHWDGDFVQRLFVFCLLPFLTLVGAQFPSLAASLGAIANPLLRQLH